MNTISSLSIFYIQNSRYLSEFYEKPLEIVNRIVEFDDQNGGLVEINIDIPIWIKPKAEGSKKLEDTFIELEKILDYWKRKHFDSPSPWIIHISNELKNHTFDIFNLHKILDKNTFSDGKPLFLNLQIEDASKSKVLFPNRIEELTSQSFMLFELSSIVPLSLYAEGQRMGIILKRGAKCYQLNGSIGLFIHLLSFGSTGAGPYPIIK